MTYPLRSVLCPTDLSPAGDAAAEVAFALTGAGGTVHLLHVDVPPLVASPLDLPPMPLRPAAPEAAAKALAEARAHLLRLVPGGAQGRGVGHEVHVSSATDAVDAILRAAETLKVDAIVLGSHGRTGLARLLLGSVAAAVSQHARVRVLLVRGER